MGRFSGNLWQWGLWSATPREYGNKAWIWGEALGEEPASLTATQTSSWIKQNLEGAGTDQSCFSQLLPPGGGGSGSNELEMGGKWQTVDFPRPRKNGTTGTHGYYWGEGGCLGACSEDPARCWPGTTGRVHSTGIKRRMWDVAGPTNRLAPLSRDSRGPHRRAHD